MGYQTIDIKVPTDYSDELIRKLVRKKLRIGNFSFKIENKSLDARKKSNIHWLLRVGVVSKELKSGEKEQGKALAIPYKKRNQKLVVVGSGPAGFFAAFVLQKAGFDVVLVERGSDVETRKNSIDNFETGGALDQKNNYAFGEGGAGTFSDGKLTSRTKRISQEKRFILESYVQAGGPEEILYMKHPHLGTDNLRIIVENLRESFREMGGEMMFETQMEGLDVRNSKVKLVRTNKGDLEADALFLGIGHSAYETYKMLMKIGVPFRTKNFAIGSRMEHEQRTINLAQWGQESLPGVKAAEYRVTSPADGKHQVFSFCMCPGGMVVPAAVYDKTNIVNGMSYYKRNGNYANAACVAAIHPDELTGKTTGPEEALDWLRNLEERFYAFSGGFQAPVVSIRDFLQQKVLDRDLKSSYPLGLIDAPLWELLPKAVVRSMQAGLSDFNRKMRGFDTGNLLGLESKTSSPVQVLRDQTGLCENFDNLYMIGEGSGYSGGIISSAADGIKSAMGYILKNN